MNTLALVDLSDDFTLSASDLVTGVLATLAYAGLGFLLLYAGYIMLDKLTPGHLSTLIFTDGNSNAGIMAAGHLTATTLVVVSAVITSQGGTFGALLDVAVFGLLALVLQAIAFKVVDKLTPGNLGEIVVADVTCPASYVIAVWTVAIGAVLAVAII